MPNQIIDACCLINLVAADKLEAILKSLPGTHFVSKQVQAESLLIRQANPDDPATLISAPIDLSRLINSKLIRICDFENATDTQLFVEFATGIDDGEASCLAIAKSRGWTVATDDRKAIRIANESNIDVITTPELLKHWATETGPKADEITSAIVDIERFSRFRLGRNSPLFEWWSNYKTAD